MCGRTTRIFFQPQLCKLDWFNQSSFTARLKLKIVREHLPRSQLSNQISNAMLANAPARENFRSSELRRDPIFHPFSRAHRNPLTIHGRRSTSDKIDIVVDQKLCDSFTNLLLRASYRSSLCCADQAGESGLGSRSCSGSRLHRKCALH